jgi:PTS system mannose-specific IIA component
MSVGLMIISHGAIGPAHIGAAEFILGESLARISVVSLDQSGEQIPDELDLTGLVNQLNRGDGVLVLTDIQGATPANMIATVARGLNTDPEVHPEAMCAIVSGLNLAMLIRVWNYRDQPLGELKEYAISGGRRGIGELL